MKKQFLLSAVLCLSLTAFGQKVHQLASPSGNIRISVELTDQIQYDVTQGNQTLMDNCVIGLETAIHQFAYRQMTWFRGMERRGFTIHWMNARWPMEEKIAFVKKKLEG